MEVSRSTLPNGLRLVVLPIEGVASTTVVVAVGVGSRYETKSKNGLSHVLEHMAFKGTKKRPSTLAIAHEIENVGGVWNAFTTNEMTAYWVKISSDHLEVALDVLADILTNSTFPEEELTKELNVIKEEMKMYQDDPGNYVQELVEEEIFGNQPIGWPIIGHEKSVSSIERADLTQIVSNYYHTGNMVIGIAGQIPPGIEKKTAKFFAGVSGGQRQGFIPANPGPYGKKVQLQSKKTEQTHLAIGLEALPRLDPDYYSLRALCTILGRGMSSRLFTTVRERMGLAYAVATFEHGYIDTGYVITYAGVSTAKVEPALSSILDQFSLIRNEKVTEVELIRAKEYLKGHLKLNTENTSWVAENIARQELLDERILMVEDVSNLIDQVTIDDIFRVAEMIFQTDRLKLALIGPFEDGNRFQKLLKV